MGEKTGFCTCVHQHGGPRAGARGHLVHGCVTRGVTRACGPMISPLERALGVSLLQRSLGL